MTRSFVIAALVVLAGTLLFAANASAVTLTYNSASCCPQQYTESNIRHDSYYNTFGNAGHWHGSSGYIYGHASCCSNLGRITHTGGLNITLTSLTRRQGGTAVWTAYNAAGSSIGSVTISGSSGTYNFPSTWTNLSRVDISFTSGNFGWDNLVVTTCSSTTAQAGGPYSVAEGSSVTLSGSGTGAANYTWDFDSGSGGGPYNDATGAGPSFSAAGINGTGSVTIGMQNACAGGAGTSSDTATVNVSNVAPSVTATIPSTGTEGTVVNFSVSATDPGPDTLTYSWSFGDGTTSTTQNPAHTYADNGSYTVTVTVSDGETTTSSTSTIVIANANPTAAIGGDSTGVEGTGLNFTGSATDPGSDTFTYSWSFGDGGTSTAQNPSHTYVDEGTGTYTVSLTVTDDDGGSNTATAAVTISNVIPVVTGATATSENEGTAVSFTVTSTDVGTADTATYAWTFGDGVGGAGSAPTHPYADDGTYTASVVATDNDGGVSAAFTVTVTISNVAPTVATISGPTTGDEGSSLSFAAVGSDPGSIDQANLTFAWNWGDSSSTGAGAGASHAWDDDTPGPYTVTVTVTDPQSATGTDTYTVTINNVAPVITTLPAEVADEAVQYTYQAGSFDPGADPANWALSASSPASASVDANGLVTWTPSFTEVGANAFTITVDDGDGGSDVQTWTVVVGFLDADGDGMPDTWETDNGLDPTVDDSSLDPDGDGLTNLDEFQNDQDPNVSGLPAPPALLDPIDGVEIDDPRPTLTWDAATDPNNDTLTYDVELYEDQAMSILVTSVSEVSDLTWLVDTQLTNENGDYYWRVRSYDGWGWSIWADLEDFFLNETNEPPGPPTALFPVGGESVATLEPSPQMDEGVDPDRDDVGHRIRVWDASGENLLTEGWIPPSARSISWAVDVTLEEDTWYSWDAQAEDEHGLTSDWIEPESFFTTAENADPLDIRWVSPSDGDYVDSVSPDLIATESSDPEGGELQYEFELDTADTFDSADLLSSTVPHGGTGTTTWSLLDDAIELEENTWWNARVRAADADGGGSAFVGIAFFVRGENDPPPTPPLISPEDGSTLTDLTPALAIGHVEDPEEDLVLYEVMVARDAELTDVIGSVTGLLDGSGPEGTDDQTSWRTDVNLQGTVYWTARAVDDRGAASEWADPWMVVLDTGEPAGPNPDDLLTGGCDCTEASFAAADSRVRFLVIALLLLVPAFRRRR